MLQRNITVDFSKSQGKMKPVNGMNLGPCFGRELEYDFSHEFSEMAVPAVRTHNAELQSASHRYIDLHCIFPDFSLDERFDSSYNFAPTDRYLAKIRESGAEIFLRIGESNEPYEVKRYTRPPRNPEKWARIAAKIIAHYNEGWCRGFKWGIKNVEIMCDADEERGWAGTRWEYFRFYSIVSKHLRARFPRLRIGAYSSGGFYALNHYDGQEKPKSYIDFLEKFLSHITSPEVSAPLDFFTWKCYATTPEEISLHSNYAKNYLAHHGLKKTKSIISEFNLVLSDGDNSYLSQEYPSRLVSSLIIAEKSDVAMMFYSSADPRAEDNLLYSLMHKREKCHYAAYDAMCFFGTLSRMNNLVSGSEDYRHSIYSLAASDTDFGVVLVSTGDYTGIIEINIQGREFESYYIRTLSVGECGEGIITDTEPDSLTGSAVRITAEKNKVYLVILNSGATE